jgi:hypothetical protein
MYLQHRSAIAKSPKHKIKINLLKVPRFLVSDDRVVGFSMLRRARKISLILKFEIFCFFIFFYKKFLTAKKTKTQR